MNGIGLFSEKSIKKCMHEMLRTFRVSVNLTVPAPKNTDTSNHSVLTTTALQALRRKPPSDTKKIPDRDGLYAHGSPAGTIAFRWDFWLGGVEADEEH